MLGLFCIVVALSSSSGGLANIPMSEIWPVRAWHDKEGAEQKQGMGRPEIEEV